jgi:hypothetical protein
MDMFFQNATNRISVLFRVVTNMDDSHWWYGVALLPLVSFSYIVIAMLLKLTGSPAFIYGIASLSVGGLFLTNVVVLFFVPVFLYLDARNLQNTNWAPDPFVYFTLGVVGLLLGPIIYGVATRYLYLRYKQVGFG